MNCELVTFKRPEGKCLKQTIHILAVAVILTASFWPPETNAQCPAPGGACATPGKDGAGGTLTGVLNAYYPGTANAAQAATSITVGAAEANGAQTAIAVGDLLLVIQMQGADINSNNTSSYGDGVAGDPGSGYLNNANLTAGRYEFVTATSAVTTAGGTVNITGGGTGTGLINAYVTAAAGAQGKRSFQVVRVPQYTTATLSSTLTAGAWDGTAGGILAIDVSTTLTLGGTVSVNGLGFRGGAGQQLTGSGGNTNNTDYRNNTGNNFHGNKGEGIAGTPRFVLNNGAVLDNGVEGYPNGSRARGAPGNAGGGGTDPDSTANDQNTGGGGGGNGGTGGVGGLSWNTQLARGGFGGVSFAQSSACRIVMGGGGGSGTRNNSSTIASSGSAGGGIVIIRTRFVAGTGTITADGADAFNNTANDGGGGAGAGGTIVVSALSSSLTSLTVSAHGGRGGDAWNTQPPGDNGVDAGNNRHGPGGGGGGGVVFLSGAAASITVSGGASGVTTTAADPFGATAGAAGTSSTTMTPDQIPGVFSGAQCTPTAVGLDSFKAVSRGGKVRLRWKTGYEADNLGFNLYREQDGQRVRITPSIVAGSALIARPGTLFTAGWSYSWLDTPRQNGGYAEYWLEDIDLEGKRTWHGPVGVDPVSEDIAQVSEQGQAVLLSKLGRSAGEPGDRFGGPFELRPELEKMTPALAIGQAVLAASPAVKISVRDEGWYRVPKQDLVAAGLNAKADPRSLQLFRNGTELPISVTGPDSSFAVEFYGTGVNAVSTDLAVYWLVAGSQPGQRIQTVHQNGSQGLAQNFPYTVELKGTSIYFPGVLNGEKENFFGDPITPDGQTDEVLAVTHLDPTAADGGILQLAIQGVTDLPHRVAVSLNGTALGEIDFAGQAEGLATLAVPRSLLKEGPSDVSFIARGGDGDISLVDYVRLTYRHTYTADNNALKFTASAFQQVTLSGFTNHAIRVMDVTDPKTEREILGAIQQNGSSYSITIAGPPGEGRTLLAFTADQAKKPAALDFNQPSSWRTPGNGADMVIITNREFLGNLNSLVALRQSQGLSVAVIDVVDLYDEFSFGQKTPQALKDFLSYAKANWEKAPHFVLLAGKASYDPKNYLGEGNFDLVPTKLIDTKQMETASDDWLVDFAGNGLPQMAIGRLPARTPQEMDLMTGKILGYEYSQQHGGVVLVSDVSDDYNFAAVAQHLKVFLPSSLSVVTIDRGASPTAKSDLLNRINQGQKVVNYNGHGTVNLWRENLLTDEDALTLGNGQNLPLFVMMTCLSGAFHDPGLDSLSESLLKAHNGGAVAVWASSGITEPGSQTGMNQSLYSLLFGNPGGGSGGGSNGGGNGGGSSAGGLTLGEAAAKAKAGVADMDVRRTWILFGDPAMRLKP